MRKGNHRAGQRFRLAANSLHPNHTPWGNYLRRMKAKPGPAGAITAMARKIAIISKPMVKNQVEYDATLRARNASENHMGLIAGGGSHAPVPFREAVLSPDAEAVDLASWAPFPSLGARARKT